MESRTNVDYPVMSSSLPKNWKQPPTPDDIIDAYEAGKTEQERINLQVLKENLKKACKTSEKLYKGIVEEAGLKCTELKLRVNGLSRFEALFIVDLDSYLTEKRKNAYKIASKLSKQSTSSTFNLEFRFFPVKGEYNRESIASDGYFLTYHPNGKKIKSRKA